MDINCPAWFRILLVSVPSRQANSGCFVPAVVLLFPAEGWGQRPGKGATESPGGCALHRLFQRLFFDYFRSDSSVWAYSGWKRRERSKTEHVLLASTLPCNTPSCVPLASGALGYLDHSHTCWTIRVVRTEGGEGDDKSPVHIEGNIIIRCFFPSHNCTVWDSSRDFWITSGRDSRVVSVWRQGVVAAAFDRHSIQRGKYRYRSLRAIESRSMSKKQRTSKHP
jgi:hypothetical protein